MVVVDVADGAGVGAAFGGFEFVDDLHGADFGAPETVPTGRARRSASKTVFPAASFPVTLETMCMTWE